MSNEEYQGNYFDHRNAFEEITEPNEVKKPRGGKRPGAGRKKEYEETTVRLKCPASVSRLANAFISILVNISNKATMSAFACRLDGRQVAWKGGGCRQWSDADAILSPFSIRVKEGLYDENLFLLAFKASQPEGVAFDHFRHGVGEVSLRWQRADEVARVMMEYGSLYAMKNRLPKDLQKVYDSVPEKWEAEDIAEWLNKPL